MKNKKDGRSVWRTTFQKKKKEKKEKKRIFRRLQLFSTFKLSSFAPLRRR